MKMTWIELEDSDSQPRGRLHLSAGDQKMLIGTFPSSIMIEPTLIGLLTQLRLPLRCPLGPLRVELVGESRQLKISGDSRGSVVLQFGDQRFMIDAAQALAALRESLQAIPTDPVEWIPRLDELSRLIDSLSKPRTSPPRARRGGRRG